MRTLFFVTLAVAASVPLAAQDGAVAAPALGFAYDPNLQAIRAIRGIPGAALLDDAVDPGFRLLSAVISPTNDFALVTAEDSSVRLLRFQNGTVEVRPLDAAMTAPDRIVFSPGGRTALLYRNPGRLQTVSGLPDRPVTREWSLPSLATPTALAVSDDDSAVVMSTGDSELSPVWLLDADGGSSRLAAPAPAALTFRANSRDLLAAIPNGDLYLALGAGPDAQFRIFHRAAGAAAVAVRFSPDGARAYTADAGGGISTIHLDSGSESRIACGCAADGLEPLNAPNLFRVTSVSDLPMMLFDASRSVPRLWFVPRGGVQ
jgi:hypothetical protein